MPKCGPINIDPQKRFKKKNSSKKNPVRILNGVALLGDSHFPKMAAPLHVSPHRLFLPWCEHSSINRWGLCSLPFYLEPSSHLPEPTMCRDDTVRLPRLAQKRLLPGSFLGQGMWEPWANLEEVQLPWRHPAGEITWKACTGTELPSCLSPYCSGLPRLGTGHGMQNSLRRSRLQPPSDSNLRRGQKDKNAWKGCHQITSSQKLWENDYCF